MTRDVIIKQKMEWINVEVVEREDKRKGQGTTYNTNKVVVQHYFLFQNQIK